MKKKHEHSYSLKTGLCDCGKYLSYADLGKFKDNDDWTERFGDLWDQHCMCTGCDIDVKSCNEQRVRKFIQKELDRQREEILKEIEKVFIEYHGYGFEKSKSLDGEDYTVRILFEKLLSKLKSK